MSCMKSLFLDLPRYLRLPFLADWVSLQDFVKLDSAMCNQLRGTYLNEISASRVVINGLSVPNHESIYRSVKSINRDILWPLKRNYQLSSMLIKIDSLRSNVACAAYRKQVNIKKLVIFSFFHCCDMHDDCRRVLKSIIINNQNSINEIDIYTTQRIDNVVQLVAESCPNLTKIDLSHCYFVETQEMIALFTYCTLLSDINVSGCKLMEQRVCEYLVDLPWLKSVTFFDITYKNVGRMDRNLLCMLLERFMFVYVLDLEQFRIVGTVSPADRQEEKVQKIVSVSHWWYEAILCQPVLLNKLCTLRQLSPGVETEYKRVPLHWSDPPHLPELRLNRNTINSLLQHCPHLEISYPSECWMSPRHSELHNNTYTGDCSVEAVHAVPLESLHSPTGSEYPDHHDYEPSYEHHDYEYEYLFASNQADDTGVGVVANDGFCVEFELSFLELLNNEPFDYEHDYVGDSIANAVPIRNDSAVVNISSSALCNMSQTLTKIDLTQSYSVSAVELVDLFRRCTLLTNVNVAGCVNMEPKVCKLLVSLPCLRSVTFGGCCFSVDGVVIEMQESLLCMLLGRFESIEVMNLDTFQVTGKPYPVEIQWEAVRAKRHLEKCTPAWYDSLLCQPEVLAKFKNLKSLHPGLQSDYSVLPNPPPAELKLYLHTIQTLCKYTTDIEVVYPTVLWLYPAVPELGLIESEIAETEAFLLLKHEWECEWDAEHERDSVFEFPDHWNYYAEDNHKLELAYHNQHDGIAGCNDCLSMWFNGGSVESVCNSDFEFPDPGDHDPNYHFDCECEEMYAESGLREMLLGD